MSVGRTSWWPCDSAEHDRELNVELGLQFGAEGPYTLRVLKDLAQQQRDPDGRVLTGFSALSRKTFIDLARLRDIVDRAAQIGALDDLEFHEDGRRFTCRVSGWKADQARGREAIKKAAQRAAASDDPEDVSPLEGTTAPVVPSEGDMSRCVPLPEITRASKDALHPPVEPVRLDAARQRSEQVRSIFDAWVASTERDPARTKLTPDRRRRIEKAIGSHGFDDCLLAVRKIGADSWARGANDRGKRFDDIEHALGTAKRIEDWRDATPRTATTAVVGDRSRDERRAAGAAALRDMFGQGGTDGTP